MNQWDLLENFYFLYKPINQIFVFQLAPDFNPNDELIFIQSLVVRYVFAIERVDFRLDLVKSYPSLLTEYN